MRILVFSKKWDKLNNEILFTTFRYPRRDKDWQIEEVVQVVYKSRSKGGGERLGIAQIIGKERRRTVCSIPIDIPMISESEAQTDGFEDYQSMIDWLTKIYFHREPMRQVSPINKLTLRKVGDW